MQNKNQPFGAGFCFVVASFFMVHVLDCAHLHSSVFLSWTQAGSTILQYRIIKNKLFIPILWNENIH